MTDPQADNPTAITITEAAAFTIMDALPPEVHAALMKRLDENKE